MSVVGLQISFLKCRLFRGRDSVVYLCLTQPHNAVQTQHTTGDKSIYSLKQIAGQEKNKIPTTTTAFHPRVHSTDICGHVGCRYTQLWISPGTWPQGARYGIGRLTRT